MLAKIKNWLSKRSFERKPIPRISGLDLNIEDIQTLRGISILLVLVAHIQFLYPWTDAAFRAVSPFGFGYGVDLFFVISGFVITRSLRRELDDALPGDSHLIVLRFWIRRVFRLWPAATLVVAVTLLVILLFGDRLPFRESGDLTTYRSAATAAVFNYMNIWGYLQVIDKAHITLLAHYWSLSLEEQFYVALPILILLARTSGRIIGTALVAVALFCFLERGQFESFAWWVRIDGLFWGVILYYVAKFAGSPAKAFNLPWCVLLFAGPVVGLILTPAVLGHQHLTSPLTLLFAVALVHVASWNLDLYQSFGWLSKFLNSLGKRSYTIYLWHLLVYSLAQLIWRGVAGASAAEPTFINALGITSVAVIALCSTDLMYRWIEIPTRNLGRRVAQRTICRTAVKTASYTE